MRFHDRLGHPLPRHRETLRYLLSPGVVRHWGRPRGADSVPVADDPRPLDVDGVQWLGHATCYLRLDGVGVLTDPVFAPRLGPVRRAHAAPLDPEDLDVDAVVVSHDHRDHLDLASAKRLRHATWYAPLGVGRWLRRRGFDVVELDWGQHAEHDGLTLHCVPADHWSRRGLFDTNRRLWCGWVLAGTSKVYFAGDTGMGDRVENVARQHPDVDVALLPIGGCEPRWFMRHKHMNPEDVVEAMANWPDAALVPIHWGTYNMSQEPLDEPPARLQAAWREAGLAPDRLWSLPVGGPRAMMPRKRRTRHAG